MKQEKRLISKFEFISLIIIKKIDCKIELLDQLSVVACCHCFEFILSVLSLQFLSADFEIFSNFFCLFSAIFAFFSDVTMLIYLCCSAVTVLISLCNSAIFLSLIYI